MIDVLRPYTENEDGSVDALELSDLPQLDALEKLEAQLAGAPRGRRRRAPRGRDRPGQHRPASSSGRTCGPPAFASAARRSGGQLIAERPHPDPAILASIEADVALDTQEV